MRTRVWFVIVTHTLAALASSSTDTPLFPVNSWLYALRLLNWFLSEEVNLFEILQLLHVTITIEKKPTADQRS